MDLVLVGRVDRRRRERAKGEESEKGGELGGERGEVQERGRERAKEGEILLTSPKSS